MALQPLPKGAWFQDHWKNIGKLQKTVAQPRYLNAILLNVESGLEGLLFCTISASDVVSSALIRHQLPVRLEDDGVEELEAVVHVDAHGVAHQERDNVNHLAVVVDVFAHT